MPRAEQSTRGTTNCTTAPEGQKGTSPHCRASKANNYAGGIPPE
jgi:hypothetical protein